MLLALCMQRIESEGKLLFDPQVDIFRLSLHNLSLFDDMVLFRNPLNWSAQQVHHLPEADI